MLKKVFLIFVRNSLNVGQLKNLRLAEKPAFAKLLPSHEVLADKSEGKMKKIFA
jgi:hypothetical protein